MVFEVKSKVGFADTKGVYLTIKPTDGKYNTTDKKEIELLKKKGYKVLKQTAQKGAK